MSINEPVPIVFCMFYQRVSFDVFAYCHLPRKFQPNHDGPQGRLSACLSAGCSDLVGFLWISGRYLSDLMGFTNQYKYIYIYKQWAPPCVDFTYRILGLGGFASRLPWIMIIMPVRERNHWKVQPVWPKKWTQKRCGHKPLGAMDPTGFACANVRCHPNRPRAGKSTSGFGRSGAQVMQCENKWANRSIESMVLIRSNLI